MKPISQFRNQTLFLQPNSLHVSAHVQTSSSPKNGFDINLCHPNDDSNLCQENERPEPHSPGQKEKDFSPNIHETNYSTERKVFSSVGNERPDLGRSGLLATDGMSTPSIIAYPEINASSVLLCSETSMSYSPGGFVKIPRSLFVHPAFRRAKSTHRHIFLEILCRATWAPTFFYWNGKRIDLSIGQLYFSRKSFAAEINYDATSDDKITENDIRGALRYFFKVNFLTSALTKDLTNGPTVVKILYREFSAEENTLPNQGGNQHPDRHLTSASPTKEEDKELKEERKYKSPRKSAAVDNAEALRLCSNFVALLSKTLPDLKIPGNLSKWQSEFDLMLRVDGRSAADIEFLFEKMPGHFYSINVQSASKFRSEFARLKGYHTQVNEGTHASVNRSWFLETKKDNARELRDWSASGEWVLNSRNSKEISLKMGHSEFKKAFLAAVGGKEIG